MSIPLHLALALWLSGQVREAPPAAEPAVLADLGAADAPVASDEPAPQPTQPEVPAPDTMALPAEPAASADPSWHEIAPSEAAEVAATADVPAAGSLAPAVGQMGGAAPTATTSFFGVRAKGQRFAFVVDKSGSMAQQGRMQRAMAELLGSTGALPDYALFRVCFFDASIESFPPQGYRKARPADLGQLRAWMGRVAPGGGTMPRVAFERLLQEGAMPDAIFFLTDGEIPADDPAWIVRRVRSLAGSVPVHCVALGEPGAVPQLQRIAQGTGGQFRFVPAEEGP